MIYHVVSMVLPTCSLQRRVCQTQTGRGLSGMIRWAGGIQCHSTFWGRGCKRYVERKVILASSEVKMREGSGQFIHLFQGLHFTFGGWTLDFPDASISLAVGDKVDQVCLKLLDSQLGEWRGCLWTATEVIYIYMYIRVGVFNYTYLLCTRVGFFPPTFNIYAPDQLGTATSMILWPRRWYVKDSWKNMKKTWKAITKWILDVYMYTHLNDLMCIYI